MTATQQLLNAFVCETIVTVSFLRAATHTSDSNKIYHRRTLYLYHQHTQHSKDSPPHS